MINSQIQRSYKTEKIYSKTMKKVLAFYITSWYIIFTPETEGNFRRRDTSLVIIK